MCGCDELPFGAACLQSSALEPVDPSEELRVGEDRLDDLLAFAVKRRAVRGAQQFFDSLRLGALSRCFLSWGAARFAALVGTIASTPLSFRTAICGELQ